MQLLVVGGGGGDLITQRILGMPHLDLELATTTTTTRLSHRVTTTKLKNILSSIHNLYPMHIYYSYVNSHAKRPL
jgi:hypothetical protein